MNSSREFPLAEVGHRMSVWYAEHMYDRSLFATEHTPSAANFSQESFEGDVVSTKWIDNNEYGKPYGWLFTIRLDDGSYRSLYECKCMMIRRVLENALTEAK